MVSVKNKLEGVYSKSSLKKQSEIFIPFSSVMGFVVSCPSGAAQAEALVLLVGGRACPHKLTSLLVDTLLGHTHSTFKDPLH